MEIVYKIPGSNHGPDGTTYDWKAVKTEEELEEALKSGWFDTLQEALNPESKRAHNEDGTFKADDPTTEDVNEAYVGGEKQEKSSRRLELESQAEELGLKFRANLGSKKLQKLIDDKLAE